jgi:hypothetical protein
MKGINGQPFIDCEQFVDIESLKKLELEICLGIAKSHIRAGIYGPGVRDEATKGNFIKYEFKYKLASVDDPLKKIVETLDHNQKNVFYKLYHGLYNASTVCYLRNFKGGNLGNYSMKGKENFFEDDPNFNNFPKLKLWINSLKGSVFSEIGRVLFFIHEHDCELPVHTDGTGYVPHNNEFIWFNPTGAKSFYIWDEVSKEKNYVKSKAAFFNDLDLHGGDKNPKQTWTLRIDGVFTEEFRIKNNIAGLSHY